MASYCFASETIIYVIVLAFLPLFMDRARLRSLIITVGVLLGAIACEILAPETYIGLPRAWWPLLVKLIF